MTWKTRSNHLSKKVSKGIGILRKAKDIIITKSLKWSYGALVQPHFDYCSLVWDNCLGEFKDQLEKLQNKAGRIITQDSYYSSGFSYRYFVEIRMDNVAVLEGQTTIVPS